MLVIIGSLLEPPAAVGLAQQSTLLIVGRICPVDYAGDDYEAACVLPLVAVGFSVSGSDGDPVMARTDAEGTATIHGIAAPPHPRFVLVAAELPGEFVRSVVYCAEAVAGTLPVTPHHQTAVALTVDAGAVLACVWYVLPEDLGGGPGGERATVTIHNRICPPDYAGGDYYGDCHGNPPEVPLAFTADGPRTGEAMTDAAGNVILDLVPGEYLVRGGVPGEFATLNVYCAPAARPATPFPFTAVGGGVRGPNDLSGIRLILNPGDAVNCDWYNTPEDLRGARVPFSALASSPAAFAA